MPLLFIRQVKSATVIKFHKTMDSETSSERRLRLKPSCKRRPWILKQVQN